MAVDGPWQQKSNDEIVAAYLHLTHYTEEEQAVIQAELGRRGLEPSGPDVTNDPILADESSSPLDNRFALAKLWLGGYPLVVAFWGWLVFAQVVFAAVLAVSSGLLFVAVALASIIYTGVALVGVWRSARRYEGPKIWSTLARVVVMLAVLGFTGNLLLSFLRTP